MDPKRVDIINTPSSDQTEAEVQLDKLEKTADTTSKILFRLKTLFPFQLIPDHIIIDLNKVNIIRKDFLFFERIHSVFIKDITDVVANLGIITGTLEIVDQGFTENSIKIQHLKNSETIKARRIIQGLIVAHKNGIDLTQIEDINNMLVKIEKIGESKRPF